MAEELGEAPVGVAGTTATSRQGSILERLESSERVTVAELAELFAVSEMTVRRDLEALERSGAIDRVHGGAVRTQSRSYEPPFSVRLLRRGEAKRRIAARAAELLAPGEAIILDAGTTTLELARVLHGQQLRVMAMSLHIASVLADAPEISLMICGGLVRPGELSLNGDGAEATFRDLFFDTYFMTVGGLDALSGASEYNANDAVIKRAAHRSARRRIVVSDGSKVGVTAFSRVCDIAGVDTLVTDSSAPVSSLDRLRQAGVEVLLAD